MSKQKISRKALLEIFSKVCNNWKTEIGNIALSQDGSIISVEESLIERAYSAANAEQKKLIKEHFKLPVTDDLFSVTDYSTVCKKLKIKELTINDFKQFGDKAKKMFATHRIGDLEKFFNGSWIADWANPNQPKHYPYFEVDRSGRLRFYGVHFNYRYFDGGAGFFKDEKTGRHIGENFIDIYQDLI